MIGQEFQSRFGVAPTVVAVSPGRINLIGEHIDYLDGCVMPIAIDRYLTIEAGPSVDGGFEFCPVGSGIGETVKIGRDEIARRESPKEGWVNYLLGVISGYRQAGVDVPGFRAVIYSNVPTGAGLSSSAALETAVALIVENLSGVSRDVVQRALICQQAEHQYAGVPCGIMDQLAVGAGKAGYALHLDCRDHAMKYFPIPSGMVLLAADTGVKHALGDGEYRKRREDCDQAMLILGTKTLRGFSAEKVEEAKEQLGDRLYRRARHAVTEMVRVDAFAEALANGDEKALGEAMLASHVSLRDDFEVSCPELDFLVETAYELGVEKGLVGSRMTGGGFGGSTVTLVRAEAAADFKKHLEQAYVKRFGRELNSFITPAVDGAHLLSLS